MRSRGGLAALKDISVGLADRRRLLFKQVLEERIVSVSDPSGSFSLPFLRARQWLGQWLCGGRLVTFWVIVFLLCVQSGRIVIALKFGFQALKFFFQLCG